ncbi:MAG: hypothetical protein UT24_C0012G0054 [Candidatus Woesebacteria bacterium GW2011_GWB1_39_12]|uniref:Uncharacterized protein n=2 Tax=Candidatus Woeseibacteriota TaxID=1752722 RepID=A0A0G0M0R2_9BACT|nr:MAG: hypothetical protein UT23_C0008G0016 [Candidatus Woesebacteria bacterium GW2011_GWA1_39_12]KKR00432.1 MAG: hypothetical protein UT24_C0012G0054 [Candidatus Woesebacteria bacterium GW2011_GWB1_39_12]
MFYTGSVKYFKNFFLFFLLTFLIAPFPECIDGSYRGVNKFKCYTGLSFLPPLINITSIMSFSFLFWYKSDRVVYNYWLWQNFQSFVTFIILPVLMSVFYTKFVEKFDAKKRVMYMIFILILFLTVNTLVFYLLKYYKILPASLLIAD